VGVHVQLRPERLAGEGEDRPALAVLELRVLVGEPGAVLGEDHDLAGGAEVGLQVGHGLAGLGVAEGEGQPALLVGHRVTVEPDPQPVDDGLAWRRRERPTCGAPAGRLDEADAAFADAARLLVK
jgi:hypothetical protein